MRTVLLGVTYAGRPMMNSLAHRLLRVQETAGEEAAQKALDAHQRSQDVLGSGKPINLADDFTTCPMEGLVTARADVPFVRMSIEVSEDDRSGRIAA